MGLGQLIPEFEPFNEISFRNNMTFKNLPCPNDICGLGSLAFSWQIGENLDPHFPTVLFAVLELPIRRSTNFDVN